MSKSEGNFFTVRDISEKYDLQILRFFMLTAHYRSPLNFSAELMESAKNGLERILTAIDRLREHISKQSLEALREDESDSIRQLELCVEKFDSAMDDDFNTADAITAVFDIAKLSNVTVSEDSSLEYMNSLLSAFEKLLDVLGIHSVRKHLALDTEIEELIEARQQARKEKNFARADEIRDKLLAKGIILEDTREGVKWKRA